MKDEFHRIIQRPNLTIRHTASRSCEFQTHSHAWLTVTPLLEGKMSIVIGESKMEIAPGQVALTNAGESHSAKVDGAEFLSVSVAPSLVTEMLSEVGSIH